uniref:Uncharacterized protein n=1 Tax=Anopheles melas TaxID=34690 RepID=A0A182UB08_9DIPT
MRGAQCSREERGKRHARYKLRAELPGAAPVGRGGPGHDRYARLRRGRQSRTGRAVDTRTVRPGRVECGERNARRNAGHRRPVLLQGERAGLRRGGGGRDGVSARAAGHQLAAAAVRSGTRQCAARVCRPVDTEAPARTVVVQWARDQRERGAERGRVPRTGQPDPERGAVDAHHTPLPAGTLRAVQLHRCERLRYRLSGN